GALITMDTPASGILPYGLVNSHAYMFEGLSIVSGTAMVQLGNPWGYADPSPIPLSQLSTGFVEIDIGSFVDSNVFIGGTGNDTRNLSGAVTNASVDLGAGKDVLTLADGTNSATVGNVETIVGGTGDDTITLGNAVAGASIDLAAGSDTLILGNVAGSASI